METIFAVMLLLGCDQSMMVCRQTADPVRTYHSMDACQADARLSARFGSQFQRPVITCLAVDGATRAQEIAIDWHIDPAGELNTAIRLRDVGQMVAYAD